MSGTGFGPIVLHINPGRRWATPRAGAKRRGDVPEVERRRLDPLILDDIEHARRTHAAAPPWRSGTRDKLYVETVF